MNNQNSYILKEEVINLLNRLNKDTDEKLKQIILLIYYEGYKVKAALLKSNANRTLRNYEIRLKRLTKGDISLQKLRTSWVLEHPIIKIKNLNRDIISLKLRYEILHRDRFKCQCCGISSIESTLHIDHKIPVALGGTNEKNNLRALCDKCNMGKSDRTE